MIQSFKLSFRRSVHLFGGRHSRRERTSVYVLYRTEIDFASAQCWFVGFITLVPETNQMLETVAIILIILWALGLVSSYTLGGFIHILLVLAVIVIAIRLIQGRRV